MNGDKRIARFKSRRSPCMHVEDTWKKANCSSPKQPCPLVVALCTRESLIVRPLRHVQDSLRCRRSDDLICFACIAMVDLFDCLVRTSFRRREFLVRSRKSAGHGSWDLRVYWRLGSGISPGNEISQFVHFATREETSPSVLCILAFPLPARRSSPK